MRTCLVALLLSPLLLAAQQSPPKGSIAGHVTNASSGEPLKKATVQLEPRGANAKAEVTISNADGSFEFTNVDPGSYEMSCGHIGFLNLNYGAKKPGQAGSILTLAAGQQVTDLTLALIPQAVITGRVVDEDGDPIQGATVEALTQIWKSGKLSYDQQNMGQSDDRGDFRLAGLEPGKYLLSAQIQRYRFKLPSEGEPKIQPVRTYYSGSTSTENATPVEVQSGQELSIEMRMLSAQTFHIRGKVAGTLPQGSLQFEPDAREVSSPVFWRGISLAKNGTFDIADVAPGSYRLTMFSFFKGPKSFGSQIINVGDADVNGVVLNIFPPASLHGRVRVEGTPTASASQWSPANARVDLSLAGDGPFLPEPQSTPKQDGAFVLEDVSVGVYRLGASGGPDGAYLKSIRFNDQEVLNKDIDFSQGVSGDADVVFRYGAAEVDGTVQLPQSASTGNGQPAAVPIFNVILVSDDGNRQQLSNTDQNGGFTLKNLTPGQYHAYAFEQLNPGQLENPAILKALEEKGTAVELKENDKKQIELSVISADDMQQILTKLGLSN